jgi:iron(III) transport system substrate-binding protein
MNVARFRFAAVLAVALALPACGSSGGSPSRQPQDSPAVDVGVASAETPPDPAVVEAAKTEAPLLVYGNANDNQMQPVLKAFAQKYPKISVRYLSVGGAETWQRYLSERATGAKTADLIVESNGRQWRDFMKRGELQVYEDPNIANLPSYAQLAPGLVAMSMDPVVAMYNAKILPADQQPKSLAELAKVANKYRGRIGTYEIENSLGYAATYGYLSRTGEDGWKTLEALAKDTRPNAGSMTNDLAQGAYVAIFNASGAVRALNTAPELLQYRYLTDATVLIPRAVGITKAATSVNAAKVFYNFMLSVEGQRAGCAGGFTPYRPGVACQYGLPSIEAAIGSKNIIFGNYDEGLSSQHDAIVQRWNSLFSKARR